MVKKKTPRWSRINWLEYSLETLARHGSAGLSLNRLISEFHVTKGSFYWHFKNQADFRAALIDYWHKTFTVAVGCQADASSEGPEAWLEYLLRAAIKDGHAQYDNVISALATHNPELMPAVRASYEWRAIRVGEQFAALGYKGRELSIRTKMFVSHAMTESQLNSELSIRQRLSQVPESLSFLLEGR